MHLVINVTIASKGFEFGESLKVAFVTDEYPATSPTEGGLASYVGRMANLLAERGHLVDVFVPGELDQQFTDGDVSIHVVSRHNRVAARLERFCRFIPWIRWRRVDELICQIGTSFQLAKAVERAEAAGGKFDLVQSCDLWFRGLFVRNVGRTHAIRCSWARDAFQKIDGTWGIWINRASAWLERLSMRRASMVYSPSEAVARYYRSVWGIPVRVLRPPLPNTRIVEHTILVIDLPSRYLVHYGQIIRRKGSDLVIEALRECHRRGVQIQLVFAGGDKEKILEICGPIPGLHALGAVSRFQVSEIVANALAAVLPSRIDNLPNTAVEALSLNTPILTTRGSSIDEIVEDGINGLVVEPDCVSALADAMISIWLKQRQFIRPLKRPATLEEMQPDNAVASFCALAEDLARSRMPENSCAKDRTAGKWWKR